MQRQLRDDYKIVAELGSGGMAVVYKAMQKSLARPVAVKELKRAFHNDGRTVRRFEREARIAASLHHENIVHVYDYWKRPEFSIVMEYVDGTDLASVLEKSGPLPVDVGVMIAVQTCGALGYAHMRGLVHRDIKPGNIMLTRSGEVKLMDFGIARARDLSALTQPGTLIGTPAYMSPEHIAGQELDARSDIFSFGIVLYELFTGKQPFSGEETRSVSAKILHDKFVAPRRINREIPRRLQRIIKKCLRKKPERRFGSMAEVEYRLERILKDKAAKPASLRRISEYLVTQNVLVAPEPGETVVMTKKPARPAQHGKLAALAAVILLLLLAAAGYVLWTAESGIWDVGRWK